MPKSCQPEKLQNRWTKFKKTYNFAGGFAQNQINEKKSVKTNSEKKNNKIV